MFSHNHTYRRLLSLGLLLLALAATSAGQQRLRTNQNKPEPAPKQDNHASLPGYKPLEIGEGASPVTTVVMALGQSTLFRCPEDPLQLVFGDPSAVQVVQATEQSKRGEFYLIPVRPNVNTNIWIELKSGTISARIRTVAIKGGAGPSDYNNEVVIRPTGYRDELANAKARLAEMEKQVADLNSKTKNATSAAEKQAAAAIDQNNTRALATAFLLTIPATGREHSKKQRYQSARSDGLFIEQIAPVRRDPSGRWWLPLSITVDQKVKKGASSTYVIDRIDTKDGRLLRASQNFPITVTPDKPATLAVMIDAVGLQSAPTPNTSMPGTIVIVLSGGKSLVFAPIP